MSTGWGSRGFAAIALFCMLGCGAQALVDDGGAGTGAGGGGASAGAPANGGAHATSGGASGCDGSCERLDCGEGLESRMRDGQCCAECLPNAVCQKHLESYTARREQALAGLTRCSNDAECQALVVYNQCECAFHSVRSDQTGLARQLNEIAQEECTHCAIPIGNACQMPKAAARCVESECVVDPAPR